MVQYYNNYTISQYSDGLIEIQKFAGEKEIKRNFIYGYIPKEYINEKLLEMLLLVKPYKRINIKITVDVF